MSTTKPPTTPTTTDTSNNQSIEENQQTSESTLKTPHHQYYSYGTAEEEWIPGSYQQPWIWHSPDVLPISPEFHGYWEKLPSKKQISESSLEYFKTHATPITKEEYNRLIEIKKHIQHADDEMEYMWNGPCYDDDE